MQPLFSCQYDLLDRFLLGSCPTEVHSLYPAELIVGFELFVDAFGSGELESNEVYLFFDLIVDNNAGSHYLKTYHASPTGMGLSPVRGSDEATDEPLTWSAGISIK